MASSDIMDCVAVFKPSGNVSSLLSDAFFGGEKTDEKRPIHAAYLHHFQTPGGAARVKLTQSSASLLGISRKNGDRLAAAVECLHNASLVQDDLQDRSEIRRGRTSVMSKFGADVALGLTDRLITASFVCLADVKPSSALPSLIRRINHAVSETVEGQTHELADGLGTSPFDLRLEAASKKSGPLFALALELPLILAGHPSHLEAAHQGACLFGTGYQLLDDLTDQAADAENPTNSNLVLAMAADAPHESAPNSAARLARRLLNESIAQVKSLPKGAGTPLIELAESLFPKLDEFDP